MGLTVCIPQDTEKLKQAISALEWQLQQEEDEKSKEIYLQTLTAFKATLSESNGQSTAPLHLSKEHSGA